MSEPILVVGASVRAAAFSILRAGHSALAADMFADADLCRCCRARRIDEFPRGLFAWFQGAPDAAWFYTGALENDPGCLRRLAALRPLLGNPGEVVAEVRRPELLAAALADAGLPHLEIRPDARHLPRDGSWLRKPRRSAGGFGIEVWDRRHSGTDRPDSQICFQARAHGQPCAATFVGAGGRAVLLGITRQLLGSPWTGASAFRYAGSLGPLRPHRPVVQAFRRIGNLLSRRFGLVGLFGVDAVVSGDQVWTVEVNPRYTASVEVLERTLGIAAVALHLEACRAGQLPIEPDWSHAPYGGKAILFARRDGVVTDRFAAYAAAANRRRPWPVLADLPRPGTLIPRGRPVATALVAASRLADVHQQLRQRLAALEALLVEA